jgi:hypothetical protein
MTTRLRSRPLRRTLLLVARDAMRRGRLRMLAGLTALATLIGGASLGFALNQPAEQFVGLQGAWPDFPPRSLSTEAFEPLDGNWAAWSEAAAVDIAELYNLADKDLDQQRQALARVRSRQRVLERALRDTRYSMIRDELLSVYGPLRLRADLFERSLDLLAAAPAATGAATRDRTQRDVRNALSALENDLRSIPNGTAWLPYVRAEEVRNAIDTPAAADVLEQLLPRLDPDAANRTDEQRRFLNRPSLRRYRNAVADFVALTNSDADANRELLRERIAALVQAIDEHEDSPTAESARAIRDARSALRRVAGPEVTALDDVIRRHFLNYNFRLVADETFVAKMVATQDIDCGPVVDYFQGARITGTQQTATNVNLEFVPSNDAARFNLTLGGVSNSRTNAVTNQATISSIGQHQFYAVKPLVFDGDLIHLGPTDLSIQPNIRHIGAATRYDNLLFGLFRNHIRRTALRRANEQLPAGRAHAARRLSENVLPQFDSEVARNFGEVNSDLVAFDNRLRQRNLAPQAERARTTADRLLFDAAIRGGDELSGAPPNIGSTRGVGFTLQIHQSLLNNVADRWGFAGRRMTDREVEAELRQWFSDLFGRNIAAENNREDREPTTLLFADEDPIRFRIANGAITLILRAGIVREDGSEIPPQLVEIPLNLSIDGDQIVFEPGTVTVATGSIPQRAAIRQRLERTIEGGSRDAFFTLERRGRSPMTLRIQRLEAAGGWLTIYGA